MNASADDVALNGLLTVRKNIEEGRAPLTLKEVDSLIGEVKDARLVALAADYTEGGDASLLLTALVEAIEEDRMTGFKEVAAVIKSGLS
jgi:hypothetical protein